MTNFEYANVSLSDYGMIIGSFSGMKDETISSGADIEFTQVKAANSDKFNLYSSSYTSPLETNFQIMKNPCIYNNDMNILPEDASKIKRWLCRKQYEKFKLDDERYSNIYWMGSFIVKDVVIGDNIVGLDLTFKANANYGYYEDITKEYSFEKSDEEETLYYFKIDNESDEIGYIYPQIRIVVQEGSDFTITEEYSGRKMEIKDCTAFEIITIDCEKQTISSSVRTDEKLAKNFNFIFPRLISTYDNVENVFIVNNVSCNIVFSYIPVCKSGF